MPQRAMPQRLIVLLVIGVVVGGLVGYLTRPESAEIKLGPLSIEVNGHRAASDGGPLTSSQSQHIAIFAVIGGLVGFGIGFVSKRKA
jgi:F0F1-type ATP synthase assembly protein I